ncbi:MAG: S41 family peptidase [Bdellovibrionota bacterium]
MKKKQPNREPKFMLKKLLTLIAVMGSLLSSGVLQAREPSLECPLLRPIAQGFLMHHYSSKKLDLEHEGRTVEQFIKRLDPSKIYLLESDVVEIRTNMRGLFQRLGQDCSSLEKSHKVLIKRLEETLGFAKKTLTPADFKFQETTELTIDPNLRKHPATVKEAQDQLHKFIQFQISNYLASDMKLPQAKKQLIHRYELNLKRQKELSRDELYSLFLDAYASALDAHSSYLSRDTLEDFEIQMRLSLEGIGAALTWEDGYTTIESLIPGGSAEASGKLQPKDKIVAVAQGAKDFESVIDMPLRDVVKLIRGPKGTTVRLTVLRQETKGTTTQIVSLQRNKINLQDEAAKLTMTKRKIGNREIKIAVIDLPSFYGDLTRKTRSSYEDLKKLIQQANKEKVDGLVLDLSKNGGGLLTEAVRIAGLFIKKGNVVATQSSREKLDLLADEDEAVDYNGPMVVLTSRLSASASEIVSGALQDYKRAVVVGADHTFGKGTVQAMMNLPANFGGGAIKVTTGMFFVPGGQSTQYRGVPADIVLPSIFSTKDIGEVSLDNSLPPKSISPFTSKEAHATEAPLRWTPVDESTVKKLRTLSTVRVEKDAEFKKILQELADLEKRKGVIKLADSLKKQKEEKADPKNKVAKGRKGKRQTDEEYLKNPHVKEAISVATDLIEQAQNNQQAAR